MDIQLSEKKLYSELILKSLDSTDPDERYRSLKFMLDTNLIQNSKIKVGLEKYLKTKQGDKKQIPNISSSYRNKWTHDHDETVHTHKFKSINHTHPKRSSTPLSSIEDYDKLIKKIHEEKKLRLNSSNTKMDIPISIEGLDHLLKRVTEKRIKLIDEEKNKPRNK